MKTCQVCKAKVKELLTVLTMGPLGFRRYKVCQKCAEKVRIK